ncbi:glucoamylase family protein [soil metagenome]
MALTRFNILERLRRGDVSQSPWDNPEPIRAEIFSRERMEQHAEALAAAQHITETPVRVINVADRLSDNAAALARNYREIGAAVTAGNPITPAAEWLIDNYHIVEEQIRMIMEDLPPKYYRQLPKLAEGPFAGHPRIMGLVWAYIAHTDSNFDAESLTRFVAAYQRVTPLTIGELWATAITLRLMLVENLRRLADRIVTARDARERANQLADRLLALKSHAMAEARTHFKEFDDVLGLKPFAVQLVQRLRDQDTIGGATLAWLEERLAAQGLTAESVVSEEHQRQSAGNVTVRNIITSMRLISDIDWPDWFESVSLVDDVLCQIPIYGEMDFPTRNAYRNAVEELSRGSRVAELEIARRVVLAAGSEDRMSGGLTAEPRKRDPGYYLINAGRATLEAGLAFQPAFFRRVERAVVQGGLGLYLGAIFVLVVLFLAAGLLAASETGAGSITLAAAALALAIPISDVAISAVNFAMSKLVDAKLLPSLDFGAGIPASARTVCVIPTMITSREGIEEMVERLETHFLADSEGEISFALLTDLADSDQEETDDDRALLAIVQEAVTKLNERYAGSRFFLCHRRRLWCAGEGRWMGWERKRGKLHELNRLLRGAQDTSFAAIVGTIPEGVRYVVTLDSDTRLPRDTARRLAGKMAHPLNRPVFDEASQRVIEGHAVMQPRVTPSLPIGHERSAYQRIFSSPRGLDPYVFAVSDVYQDLFDEGSYTGKGIYEIDSFERALAGRVPENALLSHDLFEGTFARAALVSDVELVEDYPTRYDVSTARQHRWVRGDWQLLPWITGRRPVPSKPTAGKIPALGLWKMIDNLRRSLSAPSLVATLFLAWLTMPLAASITVTLTALATLILPLLIPILNSIPVRHARVEIGSHVRSLLNDLRLASAQAGLNAIFLAHHAYEMADAVVRTLYRLMVSRRHLLEWTTAAQLSRKPRRDLIGHYLFMFASVVLAIAALVAAIFNPSAEIAAVLGVAWFIAPATAYWLSLSPDLEEAEALNQSDMEALRLIARRTWHYFEIFVTPGENHLPPDNFQEEPRPIVARRTSPTNIGLYLLSTVCARDFGWIGLDQAVERIEATLASLDKMERFKGHFYNWYGTGDLRPLEPRYISSVDSGNLAGHLIALCHACAEWRETSPPAQALLDGIADGLAVFDDVLSAHADDRRALRGLRADMTGALASLRRSLEQARETPDLVTLRLVQISIQAGKFVDATDLFTSELGLDRDNELLEWARAAKLSIESFFRDGTREPEQTRQLRRRIAAIEREARRIAVEMDFAFLLNRERNLLSIGLRADGALDTNCYDMLASEARLASFFAIAKGDVRTKHWFRLGRPVTAIDHGAALISWSGSMFEYLMPSLVMRAPQGGILDQTAKLVVRRQISYGKSLGIPWGISESAYNVRDVEFTYQYSNFGVPGLGLKRGLSENAVIAPYATALAAMVAPSAAIRNFRTLTAEGGRGRYGFYEALDYTPSRVPEGSRVAVVKAYMAHHQGMTIVALGNAVAGGIMRRRFHSDPMIMAAELLLQERAPRQVPATDVRAEEIASSASVREQVPLITRRITSLHASTPNVALLSNANYGVMLTAAGSGYSQWHGLAITRWREDPTLDDWGSYIYLSDIESHRTWSAGYEPLGGRPGAYVATFTEDRAEIIRTDGVFTTVLECLVSPEDDGEVRRLTVTNNSRRPREIDITSYMELVLAPAVADAAHQTFSKLFVQTEYLPEERALIATRRKRSPGDPDIWVAHLLVTDAKMTGDVSFETDRAAFIGRGRDLRNPAALDRNAVLGEHIGTVLDPIMSLRARLTIPARQKIRCAFWTLAASSRESLIDLIDRHRHVAAFERAAMLAWTQAQIELRHLAVSADEAALYQQAAAHLLYSSPALRPSSARIAQGMARQSALWPHGISGDIPIVLVRIDEIEDIEIVRQLLRAHEYWRKKHLIADLVILNERASSYVQDLQQALEALVQTTHAQIGGGAGGNAHIFVLRSDLLAPETRSILPAVARIMLVGRRGPLSEQLARLAEVTVAAPAALPALAPPNAADRSAATHGLDLYNGFGGFDGDGRDYVTVLDGQTITPAPWINVIANKQFGFQCGAEGGGFTWSINSREYQITPWSNDPVRNRSSEAFYIRDEESGAILSPTLLPVRDHRGAYVARHGQGYSVFEHEAQGIAMELTQFVAASDPVKISRLTLRNRTQETKRLSVTAFAELALGPSRHQSSGYLITSLDPETKALLFRNPWTIMFSDRAAFLDMGGRQNAWTSDRQEFLGRHGDLRAPFALVSNAKLSGATGGGLDACGVLQTSLVIAPGEEKQIQVILGDAPNEAEAKALIARYRQTDTTDVLKAVKDYWEGLLGTVKVKTPDRSMDVFLNRWALYQTLACRSWARAGFYQASGAYGFRDQLQDCLALLHTEPALAREQILLAASRQFPEGDVQHWWLPPAGNGLRTRISDDMVWLIYCVSEYLAVTGDTAILDEKLAFLEGQALTPGDHDAFFQPTISEETASLYEHCRRAIIRSLTKGPHGLPLMGTGDWNDGMNRVGEKGQGESIWLAWFTIHAIDRFAPVARERGDAEAAGQWLAYRGEIASAIETAGWDGNWYRRGYFDDGTPLGSADNHECRIDSIAQSWAVLSGAANKDRAKAAMAEVKKQLIDEPNCLALLFTPPFDTSLPDPGYIKAYPPGVRENGGQYTHAATWSVYAFAELGEREMAHKLFAMLNPINHARNEEEASRYKVEPYAVAADIYSVAPHQGRGGWTWYTGSAGWLYRAGLEAVLGLRRRGDQLTVNPCVPDSWNEFEIAYRFGKTTYRILATRGGAGAQGGNPTIILRDDGGTHDIRIGY